VLSTVPTFRRGERLYRESFGREGESILLLLKGNLPLLVLENHLIAAATTYRMQHRSRLPRYRSILSFGRAHAISASSST